ncbi:hypothetical protein MMC12_008723, partial [Toensbergia leucococca]|nr:hypothetical protein [Toensbergia leucococca]
MEDYPLNLLNPARLYQPSFHATSMESSFKLDEGYSEEVRSQDGSESSMRLGSRTGDMLEGANPVVAELANGLLALNEADRSEFAYNVIRTLRTSSIAAIVDRLRPILHRDPVNVLPTEITSQIFSYLAPSTLLRASIASQAWRQRCYDSQLWKQKFTSEGWGLEMDEVRRFEQNYRYSSGPLPQKSRSRRAETNSEQNRRRKRARAGGDARVDTASPRSLQGHSMAQDERQGTPESELASTVTQDFSHDEEMQDVDSFLVATNTPRRRESFDPVALQAPSRFQYSTMHIDENMMTSDTR